MEDKKVALITGGTRGIGKAIAIKFAKNGYNLVLNYVSDRTNLEELENEFKEYNIEVLFIKTDVSNFEDCENMAKQAIARFEKIDVLVNNAGITKDSLLLRMTPEDFDKVININLKGTFNVTKSTVPYMMKKRTGKIVNISSVVGVSGNAGQCNYAASKAGIIGFTKSIAKELASRNILANCVAPGFIDTDMTSVLSDSVKENIKAQIPLKRMGSSEEIANYLASQGKIGPSILQRCLCINWNNACKTLEDLVNLRICSQSDIQFKIENEKQFKEYIIKFLNTSKQGV